MSESFVGEVRLFGFNFVPEGWHACDGSLLSIAENEVLFSLLGTTYGGDGQTTFGVPDLRGQVPLHQGTGPGLSARVIGQGGGSEAVTLTAQQVAAHGHAFVATSARASTATPSDSVTLGAATADALYTSTPSGDPLVMSSASTLPAGGSQPHDNVMPTLAVQFCISLWGIYPTRN